MWTKPEMCSQSGSVLWDQTLSAPATLYRTRQGLLEPKPTKIEVIIFGTGRVVGAGVIDLARVNLKLTEGVPAPKLLCTVATPLFCCRSKTRWCQ